MRLASLLLQPVSYVAIIIAFFLTILPGALLALPFSRDARTRINAPFWQAFSRFTLYVATLSRVKIIDERPLSEQKAFPRGLYIANHQSFVDIPLVIIKLPIPPIMKKEVLYIPLLGICGYSAGAIVVDRKDGSSRRKVFEQSKERLTKGLKTLLYYPEGTRQKGAEFPKPYEEIKTPILKFAYEQNIPTYCVSLYGTKKTLDSRTGLIRHRQSMGMLIRPAKTPRDYPDQEAFMRKCWKDVCDGYAELAEKLT